MRRKRFRRDLDSLDFSQTDRIDVTWCSSSRTFWDTFSIFMFYFRFTWRERESKAVGSWFMMRNAVAKPSKERKKEWRSDPGAEWIYIKSLEVTHGSLIHRGRGLAVDRDGCARSAILVLRTLPQLGVARERLEWWDCISHEVIPSLQRDIDTGDWKRGI